MTFTESGGSSIDFEQSDQRGGDAVEPGVSETSESEDESDLEFSTSPLPSGSWTQGDNETSLQTNLHHPAVSSGDFARVVQLKGIRKLTDHETFFLLSNHFIPTRNYKFPARFVSGRNRHFQQSWLDQHNGLVYSESENGGYCKYCVIC